VKNKKLEGFLNIEDGVVTHEVSIKSKNGVVGSIDLKAVDGLHKVSLKAPDRPFRIEYV